MDSWDDTVLTGKLLMPHTCGAQLGGEAVSPLDLLTHSSIYDAITRLSFLAGAIS